MSTVAEAVRADRDRIRVALEAMRKKGAADGDVGRVCACVEMLALLEPDVTATTTAGEESANPMTPKEAREFRKLQLKNGARKRN